MANWEDLAALVEERVPAGKVTRYGDLAQVLCARRDTQAVGSMLGAWLKRDVDAPTHRVVHDDGSMRNVAGLPDQRGQLEAEGVSFTPDGRVDFGKCPYVGLE